MALMRLADVNQRQHHENKRLQRDDQNMKDRPDGSGKNSTDPQQATTEGAGPSRTHQSDQHEYQFASIHVAEQPHSVRYRLGDKLDHLHREVDWVQQWVATKGSGEQFVGPTTNPLDLYAVVDGKQKYA